jgi:hypothetical protein
MSLLAALFLGAAVGRAEESACRFSSPPAIVIKEPSRVLQHWDVDDSPRWSSGMMPDSPAFRRFIRYVRARMDVSALDRYIKPSASATGPDERNTRLMLSEKIGDVAPIDCLEALLFSEQAMRHPMETRPTEFLALVLRRDERGKGRLRIWYFTVDQPGIGRPGPIVDAVTEDVKAGWKPVLNLHNHNFFFDKSPVVPGVPWPSANDAQVMKNLTFNGLPVPRTGVTNGFVTSHLKPQELQRFQGADEK